MDNVKVHLAGCQIISIILVLLLVCTQEKADAQLKPNSNSSCLSGASAWYRGTLNHTKSGIPCQRWDTNTPHNLTRVPNDGPQHNYCRNPDYSMTGLWCYTMNVSVRWEICDLPKCPDDSLLLYTSGSKEGMNLVSHYPADPETLQTKPQLHDTVYNSSVGSNLWTLASDKRQKRIFFTDLRNDHLVTLHLDTNKTTTHMRGMIQGIEAITYDWLNKNLYFVDGGKSLVGVTDANFTYFSKIYQAEGEGLAALTMHVPSRLLFFTIYMNNREAIKSCSLDGGNVTVVVPSILLDEVISLSVDYLDQKLYWVNNHGAESIVWRAQFNGSQRQEVFRDVYAKFWSIATYQDTVFLADQLPFVNQHAKTTYKLFIVSKDGNKRMEYELQDRIRALSIYSTNEEYSNIELNNVCYPSNPCEHICLESYDQKRSCACSIGYKKVGKHRCEPKFIEDNFLVTIDTALKKIFQLPLDNNKKENYSVLAIDGHLRESVTGLALDASSMLLYWYDRSTSTIYKANLKGSNVSAFAREIHVKSLEVDPQTGNVYFADDDFDYIFVISSDGHYMKTLLTPSNVTSNYTRIQSIALDLHNKFIYWSATSSDQDSIVSDLVGSDAKPFHGQVRRMGLDGSNIELVLDELISPGPLTISFERKSLFVLANGKTVYEMPLDDLNHTNGLLPDSTKRYDIAGASILDPINSLAVDGPYIYTAEHNFEIIRRLNISNEDDYIHFGSNDLYARRHMAIYNSTAQKAYAQRATGCYRLNCQHMCLQTPNKTYICSCANFHRLANQSTNICVGFSGDHNPPTYSYCPVSFTLRIPYCTRSISLPSWPEITWTDDATPRSNLTTSKPKIASLYRFGVHHFTYTATDAAGNVGRCSFSVTIKNQICKLAVPRLSSSPLQVYPSKCLNGDLTSLITCKKSFMYIQYGKVLNKTLLNVCLPSLKWLITDFDQLSCTTPRTTSSATIAVQSSSAAQLTNAAQTTSVVQTTSKGITNVVTTNTAKSTVTPSTHKNHTQAKPYKQNTTFTFTTTISRKNTSTITTTTSDATASTSTTTQRKYKTHATTKPYRQNATKSFSFTAIAGANIPTNTISVNTTTTPNADERYASSHRNSSATPHEQQEQSLTPGSIAVDEIPAKSSGLNSQEIAGVVIAVLLLIALTFVGFLYARKKGLLPEMSRLKPISIMWSRSRDQVLTKYSNGSDYEQFS